jgi:hypothetical protein
MEWTVCTTVSCNNAPSKRIYWDINSTEADLTKFPPRLLQETGIVAVPVFDQSTFNIHVVNVS